MTTDQTLKQALEALKDMRSGWQYIRGTHGDLSGVGWDRAQNKVDAAIEAIEQHKPVVRMLTDEEVMEINHSIPGSSPLESAKLGFADGVQRKAAEVWGLTIGEHG